MNVVPKKAGEHLLVMPAKDHYVLECEVTSPPSSKRRTVYLILDNDDATTVLLSLREHAIYARSKPMTDSDNGGPSDG